MGNALLGYPLYSDVTAIGTPALSGGNWPAALPLTNLQTRDLYRVARSNSAALADTQFDVDLLTPRQVRILALLGHTISIAGTVRVRGFSASPIFDVLNFTTGWTPENAPIVTTGAFTCADGVPLDLLEDANGAAVADEYIPIVFTGNGTKAFRFTVARFSAYASHRLEIFDVTAGLNRLAVNIDFSAAGAVCTIVAGAGTIVSTTAVGDGSFDVLCTAPGVVAANTNRVYVTPAKAAAADLAKFYVGDFMAWDAAADQLVYDAGIRDAWPAVFPAGSIPSYHPSYATSKFTAEDAAGVALPFVVVPAAPQNARYWRWQIRDTTNAAGYVDVGRLVMAYGYRPSINMEYGMKLAGETATTRTETDGGGTKFNTKRRRRRVTMALADLPADEALVGPFDMQLRIGTSEQVFFVFDEADTTLLPRRSMLCVQGEMSAMQMATFNRFGVPFSLVEEI